MDEIVLLGLLFQLAKPANLAGQVCKYHQLLRVGLLDQFKNG
jgi:hypothetical protein